MGVFGGGKALEGDEKPLEAFVFVALLASLVIASKGFDGGTVVVVDVGGTGTAVGLYSGEKAAGLDGGEKAAGSD